MMSIKIILFFLELCVIEEIKIYEIKIKYRYEGTNYYENMHKKNAL